MSCFLLASNQNVSNWQLQTHFTRETAIPTPNANKWDLESLEVIDILHRNGKTRNWEKNLSAVNRSNGPDDFTRFQCFVQSSQQFHIIWRLENLVIFLTSKMHNAYELSILCVASGWKRFIEKRIYYNLFVHTIALKIWAEVNARRWHAVNLKTTNFWTTFCVQRQLKLKVQLILVHLVLS